MKTDPRTFPLSASQELLWEHMAALSPGDPGAAPEVAVCLRELLGPLDPELFRRAVAEVAARHDPLRMRFVTTGRDPLVVIEPGVETPLGFADLSALPGDRQEKELSKLCAETSGQPFDLGRAPLWRAWLVRLSSQRHVLIAAFFHLVADGWSTRVFAEEAAAWYGSLTGRSPAPSEVCAGFPEIFAMQARELAETAARREFWRRSLRPVPKPVAYPVRSIDPRTDVRATEAVRFRFAAHVGRRLRGIAWRARTTEYVVLLTAYHILHRRRTDAERIVIGTTTLGRSGSPARRLIGQFTNDVYMATDIRGESSLADTVRQVHDALEAAMTNAVSFKSLAGAANPDFAAERPWPDLHLFDSYLQAEPPAAPDLEVAGLRVRQLRIGQGDAGSVLRAGDVPASRLPIWIKKSAPFMLIDDDRLGGALVCNPGFFEEGLAKELVAEYVEIVEALAEDPSMPVAAVTAAL
ncbi:condensation domain-containing protein [Nonomuraea sp. NPDC003707]